MERFIHCLTTSAWTLTSPGVCSGMSLVVPDLLSGEPKNLYIRHLEGSLNLARWLILSSWAFASFSHLDLQSTLGAVLELFPKPGIVSDLALGSPVSRPHLLNLPVLSGICSEWARWNLTCFLLAWEWQVSPLYPAYWPLQEPRSSSPCALDMASDHWQLL